MIFVDPQDRNNSKLLIDRGEEPRKRRRLDDVILNHNDTFIGLCDLILEVLVHVLTFLPSTDRDNFAIVSIRCTEVRSHPSLDQRRRGTVVIKGSLRENNKTMNAERLLEEIKFRGWDRVFRGNRVSLRMKGLELVQSSKMKEITSLSKVIKLQNVTTLDASYFPFLEPKHRVVRNSVAKTMSLILPNLRELDISYMKVTETAINSFARHCPNLEIFRWNGSSTLQATGENLKECRNLKEIYLDNSSMHCEILRNENTPVAYDENQSQIFVETLIHLLCMCSSELEKVSITRGKWYSWDITMPSPLGKDPMPDIPQKSLIRFVESSPRLKWFRSDLCPENIVLLQKQFPAITFC